MSNINFDNPWLLLIGIPLILAAVIPFIIAINKENKTVNNVLSFINHIIIALLVTLAIAKTTYEMVITETNIYVLADVSYSSNNNLSKIDQYIEDLTETTPKNSKIGIVCFGRDYELLVQPGEELKSVSEANVDDSATNIAEALEYTATLFTDDVIKRIVIISDGKETKQSNIVSIVHNLSADGIYIDAIYLDNNINENVAEVQINQIEYVPSTYLNTAEKVYSIIQSSVETRAFVSLYRDGEKIKEKAVTLYDGYNSVTVDLDTSIAGSHNYRIEVQANSDTSAYNNAYLFNQKVAEKVKMLFVSEEEADRASAESLYGQRAEIDYFINDPNVPFTVEDLCVYDEFVLSNVDVRHLKNHNQFVSSLDTLVSEFGKSLITLGNTYIQNNYEDETLSSLSNMLPVKYGNDEDEEKLVTLVLDISRSMEQLYKLQIAKEVVCSILDNLSDNTMVMIIVFFGEVSTVTSPTPASEREAIKEEIRNLEAYQGTFMGSALEYTHDFVTSLPYVKNEVILISDGLPYGEQASPAATAVQKLALSNILVSTIHVVSDTATAVNLMKQLAIIGKGYYYFIKEVDDVESLILNEVLNSLKETVLEANESPVSIMLSKDDLVEGVEILPNVKGLYNNIKKSNVEVVLNAIYTDFTEHSYTIPLYTYWDYGNGKVASFASSISGDWITHWNADESATQVLKNILDINVPSQRIDTPFIFEAVFDGTISSIQVNAPTLNKDSKLNIKVTYPDSTILEKELIFDSELYSTEIESEQIGQYIIELSYTLGELSYSATHLFNISYLPEYDSFTRFEASNLYYMVSENGIISEDGKLVLENDDSNVQKYIIDFTPAFMIISVVLFVIDIMIRKLRLQDIKSLFKVFNKKEFNRRGGSSEKKN